MPALTRRRYPERPDCWHVYFGDTCVGTIARRSGVPVDVDQWGWDCGFYPASHRGIRDDGTAETFEQARGDFERAWRAIFPRCTDADFVENRRARAFTAWKYKMWDSNHRLPTQMTSGRSKCFCGQALAIPDVADHVHQAHMDMA
jgi:hypothetical protein